MKHRLLLALFILLLHFSLLAQTNISGKITDANTGEALIGATIIYGKGKEPLVILKGIFHFLFRLEKEI